MQKFEKMPFNETCVDTLEKLLEHAKKGRVNFVAFSVCEGPLQGYDGFVGEVSSFYTGYYGLQRCSKRIMARLDELIPEEPSIYGPPDKYVYDVSREPVSHDFIAWLVTIKMLQAKEGKAGKTKLCFLRQKTEHYVDQEYRAAFFASVMMPALELFDIERTEEAKEGRRVDCYTYCDIVEMAKAGQSVPRITVPAPLMADMRSNLDGKQPVTITLREHKHWEHRNSSMTDWLRFADYLQSRGEHVIFVRDYAQADEDITGFETMPEASKNFAVRAALYENARCNLFVSNGPSTLGLFGSRPWLQFVDVHADEEYIQNRPDWWFRCHGLAKGDQFPWCEPNQRIIWQPDTYENMVTAWEEVFPAKMAEAAA